jgi:hypothetical protein
MATHFLAQGGHRVNNVANYVRSMFPSVPMGKDEHFEPDSRRTNVRHAITRCFDLSCGSGPCNCDTAACRGSLALKEYVKSTPIANNDAVVLVYIPRLTSLDRIYWAVETPIASGTANIRFVPGTGPAVVLAANVPLNAVAQDLLDVWAINGSPLFAEQNGHVEIVVSGLPANPPAVNPCGCTTTGGINGLNLTLTATVERYRTGCY